MNQPKPLPPLSTVKGLLDYHADTGEFKWKIDRGGKARAGLNAGCAVTSCYKRNLPKTYLMIKINGIAYPAHRLAWLLAYGSDPGEKFVDHVNQDSLDNRIVNLRLVSPSENNWNNNRPQGNSTSKSRGVYFHKQSGKWAAEIRMNKQKKFIGVYNSLPEAEFAYASEYDKRLASISSS
jgi:hypothetical protein